MYANLKLELTKNGITQKSVAEFLGIHENSVSNKLSGDSSFTVEEAFSIKEHFSPSCDLQYLFRKTPRIAKGA